MLSGDPPERWFVRDGLDRIVGIVTRHGGPEFGVLSFGRSLSLPREPWTGHAATIDVLLVLLARRLIAAS